MRTSDEKYCIDFANTPEFLSPQRASEAVLLATHSTKASRVFFHRSFTRAFAKIAEMIAAAQTHIGG